MRKAFTFALFLVIAITAFSCGTSPEVYDLRCEGLTEPLGIDSFSPHFSWKVRSRTPMTQAAYEIQVASSPAALKGGRADIWDSGRVESADQVMVPFLGENLSSRMICWWRVRVWRSEKEASPWSAPARFGIGVIGSDCLRGEYIGAVPGEGRSPKLRREFEVTDLGTTAILYVNSLGYHEAYINGRRVSEAVLTPAVSQLDKRSLIVAYDVTGLLKKGKNEIMLWTSSGWYKPAPFGAVYDGPLVKAELDSFSDGGLTPLVWTDSLWQGAWSGRRDYDTWSSGHFGGEVIDSRVSSLEWGPVDVVRVEGIEATPQMCEPCLVQETLRAESIESAGGGKWIVDFGRIINGMLEVKLPRLPAGHQTRVSYSDFRGENDSFESFGDDIFISSGSKGGDLFGNKFNHHVFRYVILDSLPEAPRPEDIKGHRMRTDFKAASSFESSDEDLDRIHDMVRCTLENLAFDGYMVDCANIERLGYGGDGNASTLSLQIMFDVAPLYINWLAAWNDVIHEDGGLPHTAPCPIKAGGGPYWCGFIVQAPWRTYMSYGDGRLLERCYPQMKHWLDYVDAYTVDGLLRKWPETPYRSWYLGDWAAPDGVDVTDPRSVDLVNNCSLCQVYTDLEAIANLLGRPEEAAQFRDRYEALSGRINEELYDPEDATYGSGSQIDMAYPLLVGIVPDSLRTRVRDCLVERTGGVYGGHLKTGLVGVPVITEWATLAGECDLMYGMLKRHGYPGYLHMLDNGASGTWEHWNANRSRLHNCFNGIGSWFYQALGGLIPDAPGYRHIRIEPQIPEGLEWVKVTKETPYGTVVIRRQGRNLHFEIPVGVSATVGGNEYSNGSYDIEI